MSLPDTASLNEMKQAVRDNQMNKGEGKILLSQSKADLLSKMMRAGKIRDTHTVFGNNPNQGRVNTGSLMTGKDMAGTAEVRQMNKDLGGITIMNALMNMPSDIGGMIHDFSLAGRIARGDTIPWEEIKPLVINRMDEDEDFLDHVRGSEDGRLDFGYYNMDYFIKELDIVRNFESEDEYDSDGEELVFVNERPRNTKALIEAISDEYHSVSHEETYLGEVEELQGIVMEETNKDEAEYHEAIYNRELRGKAFPGSSAMVDKFVQAYMND